MITNISNKIKKIDYNKILSYLLCVIILFLPMREFLALYLSSFIKGLPDIILCFLLIVLLIKKQGKFTFDFTDIIFLIFIVYGFFNSVFVKEVGFLPYILQVRSITLYYLVYFIFKNTKESLNINVFIKFLKISIYFIFLLTIIEKVSFKELLFPLEWIESISNSNFNRTYSFFNNPNTYASFLFLSLFFLYKFETDFWTDRMIPIVGIVISGIIFSISRSIMLSFFIFVMGVSIFVALDKKHKLRVIFRKRHVVFNVIITFLISFFLVFGISFIENYFVNNFSNSAKSNKNIGDRLNELTETEIIEKSSTNGRIFKIKKGLEIYSKNPIFGTGFGTYGSSAYLILGSNVVEEYGIEENFYSDNEYIKVLVETGLIGAMIFTTFIFSLYYRYRYDKDIILLISIVLFIGLFYNVFEVQIVSFLFWLTLGKIENNKIEGGIS